MSGPILNAPVDFLDVTQKQLRAGAATSPSLPAMKLNSLILNLPLALLPF